MACRAAHAWTTKPYTITVKWKNTSTNATGQFPAAGVTFASTTGLEDFYDKVTTTGATGHGSQTEYTIERYNNVFLFRPAANYEITDVEVQGSGLDYIIATHNEVIM